MYGENVFKQTFIIIPVLRIVFTSSIELTYVTHLCNGEENQIGHYIAV